MNRRVPTDTSCLQGARFATWEVPVCAAAVRALFEVLDVRGCSREPLLRRLGTRAEQLHLSETRIAYRDSSDLCEVTTELTGDAALGLHCAAQLSPQLFSPVSLMLTRVQSLRQAFELVSQYGKLFCDEPFLLLKEGPDEVVACVADWLSSSEQARFSVEFMLAGLARMVRTVSGEAAIVRVCFAYEDPEYRAEYDRIFRVEVRFSQPQNGIVMSRDVLDRPAPAADPDVQSAMQSVAEMRMRLLVRATTRAVLVRQLALRRLPGRTDMNAAAYSARPGHSFRFTRAVGA